MVAWDNGGSLSVVYGEDYNGPKNLDQHFIF